MPYLVQSFRRLPVLLLWGLAGCFWVSSDNIDARWDIDGDGVDRPNDCDDTDARVGVITWYADVDGDGFGNPSATTTSCTPVVGGVEEGTDCDDDDPKVYVGAVERCNGVDDNCDGTADEGLTLPLWYKDLDEDGYGDPDAVVEACQQTPGTVGNADDCDDLLPEVNPEGIEVCNGIDDNCRDGIDLEDASLDSADHQWYRDADGDAYGDDLTAMASCDDPSSFPAEYVAVPGDCNDGDPAIHPFAGDICEDPGPQVDNDCDGSTDNPLAPLYLYDNDGDGFGDPAVLISACEWPPNTVALMAVVDCDDTNPCINPTAREICNNGIDEDCDTTDGTTGCDTASTGGTGTMCP